jgi:hypothetical protein
LVSVNVTHPFHPLRGQTFIVLKRTKVAGIVTLCLRHPDLGTFAIPQDWTDWSPAVSPGTSLMIDAFGLVELAMIVESLTCDSKTS